MRRKETGRADLVGKEEFLKDMRKVYLLVVTECLVEQGKSVINVLGDGYGIALIRLGPSENLDTFSRYRLRRFAGKLGPSHVQMVYSTIDFHHKT